MPDKNSPVQGFSTGSLRVESDVDLSEINDELATVKSTRMYDLLIVNSATTVGAFVLRAVTAPFHLLRTQRQAGFVDASIKSARAAGGTRALLTGLPAIALGTSLSMVSTEVDEGDGNTLPILSVRDIPNYTAWFTLAFPLFHVYTRQAVVPFIPGAQPHKLSMVKTLTDIVKHHGVRGLFSGYTASLAGFLSCCSITLSLYQLIPPDLENGKWSPTVGWATIIAVPSLFLLWYPCDTISKRHQQRLVRSLVDPTVVPLTNRALIRRLWAKHSLPGFYRGLSYSLMKTPVYAAVLAGVSVAFYSAQ